MTAAIESIQALAGQFRDNQRNLTLYFPDLTRCPGAESYHRVFGPPVGLTDAQWPTFPELGALLQQANALEPWDPRDRRMEHVFTVDLRGVNLLGAPRDATAMMLFISHASFHRACHDGNPHTAVRFVRNDELQRGVYRGPLPARSLSRWSRRFSLIPVDVPGDVFDVPHLDLPDHDPRARLYQAIARAPARLGGCPIGLADDGGSSDGWDESSPTVPWGARASDERSTTVSDECGGNSGPAITASPDLEHHHRSGSTLPYENSHHRSSSTIPYEARRRSEGARGPSSPPSGRSRESSSPFLMQFHRRFADIELGRSGIMYVSGRSGYYQS